MRKAHRKVFSSGRVELFDQTTASWEFSAVLGYIRYMVKALDCNIIMIDPLSVLVALMGEMDERKAIDKGMVALANLGKELNVHIDINHHLTRPPNTGKSHEEGGQTSLRQLRGSNGIGQFASQVVGFERNQQAEGAKSTLAIQRLLKNRFVGWDGVAGYTQYSPETGMTYDIPYEEGKALWGDEKDSPSGFNDASGEDY
jgi:hypothetical protein